MKVIDPFPFHHLTFNFLPYISSCEKKNMSTSSLYVWENKSFIVYIFARKTEVSSYKRWREYTGVNSKIVTFVSLILITNII